MGIRLLPHASSLVLSVWVTSCSPPRVENGQYLKTESDGVEEKKKEEKGGEF